MDLTETIKAQRLKHITALLLLCLVMFLPGLSNFPVIDRDEARFAQASVQMAESGDLLDIKFQEDKRYKKPAGIYWLQTATIKVFSSDGERKIWAQRLPSVLGGILAVLATYWGAARMIGRRGAFIAASLLGVSALVVFESHIAKTDAMLLGLSTLCFGTLAHLRHGGGAKSAWLFWIALGFSIMIKGPITPILVSLSLITLAIWERKNGWMKAFLNVPAILVFLIIWVPWAITMWVTTDGAFFVESVGKDFSGKLISTQERHSGPPGYYFGFIWLTLWPSCLLLLPAFAFAIRAVKNGKESDAAVVKAMRLCLAWVLPYWALIEFMPTKLPHYALPLFPALCVMAGAAALTLFAVREFSVLRRINAVIYFITSAVLITLIMAAQTLYGGDKQMLTYAVYGIGGAAGLAAVIASFGLWQAKMQLTLISAGLSAVILSVATYQFIMPNLTTLRVTDQIVKTLEAQNIALPRQGGVEIISPHFTEPSLVYRLGTSIDVTDRANLLDMSKLAKGRIIILDYQRKDGEKMMGEIRRSATQAGICTKTAPTFQGINYSKGDDVEIAIIRAVNCPSEAPNAQSQPSE